MLRHFSEKAVSWQRSKKGGLKRRRLFYTLIVVLSIWFSTSQKHFHMQLIRQKIWFVYVNSYQSACDNPEINPAASLRLFLITLLCCLSSAADSWKEEAFSIRNSSPSELQFLPHALLLCVCKLFGNLSNFTLVRFPCKRQHFRKKPSGWVNVISNCVCVCVRVCKCGRS